VYLGPSYVVHCAVEALLELAAELVALDAAELPIDDLAEEVADEAADEVMDEFADDAVDDVADDFVELEAALEPADDDVPLIGTEHSFTPPAMRAPKVASLQTKLPFRSL
jgi:hypothetical protein